MCSRINTNLISSVFYLFPVDAGMSCDFSSVPAMISPFHLFGLGLAVSSKQDFAGEKFPWEKVISFCRAVRMRRVTDLARPWRREVVTLSGLLFAHLLNRRDNRTSIKLVHIEHLEWCPTYTRHLLNGGYGGCWLLFLLLVNGNLPLL